MKVAASLETILDKDIGHRIRQEQLDRLAQRCCREHDVKPNGTASAAVILLEYSGYLRQIIPSDRERPTEYHIRGRQHVDLKKMHDTHLLAEMQRRMGERS